MADDDTNDDEDSRLRPSPDDALEPPDDIYNPKLDEDRLEEDDGIPTEPASPHLTTPKLPPDHPVSDGNIDFQELYDEGFTSATDYDAQAEESDTNDDRWPLEPEDNEDQA